MEKDYIDDLYDALSVKYPNMKTSPEDFRVNMQDPNKVAEVHTALTNKGFKVMPLEQFKSQVAGTLKKKEPSAPVSLPGQPQTQPGDGLEVSPTPFVPKKEPQTGPTLNDRYQLKVAEKTVGPQGVVTGEEQFLPAEAPVPTAEDPLFQSAEFDAQYEVMVEELTAKEQKEIDDIEKNWEYTILPTVTPEGKTLPNPLVGGFEKLQKEKKKQEIKDKYDVLRSDLGKQHDLQVKSVNNPLPENPEEWQSWHESMFPEIYKEITDNRLSKIEWAGKHAGPLVPWMGTVSDKILSPEAQEEYEYYRNSIALNDINSLLRAGDYQAVIKSGYHSLSEFEEDSKLLKEFNDETISQQRELDGLKSKMEELLYDKDREWEISTWKQDLKNSLDIMSSADEASEEYKAATDSMNKISKEHPEALDIINQMIEYSDQINNLQEEVKSKRDEYDFSKVDAYMGNVGDISVKQGKLNDHWKNLVGTQFKHLLNKEEYKKNRQAEIDRVVGKLGAFEAPYGIVAGTMAAAWSIPKTLEIPGIVASAINDDEYDSLDAFTNFIGDTFDQENLPITSRIKNPLYSAETKGTVWDVNAYNLPYNVANTVSHMYALIGGGRWIGGGVKQLAQKGGGLLAKSVRNGHNTGVFLSSMMLTTSSYYENALEHGLNREDASRLALTMAGVTSALEMISPNQIMFRGGGAGLVKAYKNILTTGVTKKEAAKYAAKMLLKEVGSENVQELTQLLADQGMEYLYNDISGNKAFDPKVDVDEMKLTAGLTTISTLIATGTPVIKNSRNAIYNDALYTAAANKGMFFSYLDSLAGEKIKTLYGKEFDLTEDNIFAIKSSVDQMASFLESVPKKYSEEDKLQALGLFRKKIETELELGEMGITPDMVYNDDEQEELQNRLKGQTELKDTLVAIDKSLDNMRNGVEDWIAVKEGAIEGYDVSREETNRIVNKYLPEYDIEYIEQVDGKFLAQAVPEEKLIRFYTSPNAPVVLEEVFHGVFHGMNPNVRDAVLNDIDVHYKYEVDRWMEHHNMGDVIETQVARDVALGKNETLSRAIVTKQVRKEAQEEVLADLWINYNLKGRPKYSTKGWRISRAFKNMVGIGNAAAVSMKNGEFTELFDAIDATSNYRDIRYKPVGYTTDNLREFRLPDGHPDKKKRKKKTVENVYKEDEQRIPGSEQEREAIVEEKPVKETGAEETSAGGVLQSPGPETEQKVQSQEEIDNLQEAGKEAVEANTIEEKDNLEEVSKIRENAKFNRWFGEAKTVYENNEPVAFIPVSGSNSIFARNGMLSPTLDLKEGFYVKLESPMSETDLVSLFGDKMEGSDPSTWYQFLENEEREKVVKDIRVYDHDGIIFDNGNVVAFTKKQIRKSSTYQNNSTGAKASSRRKVKNEVKREDVKTVDIGTLRKIKGTKVTKPVYADTGTELHIFAMDPRASVEAGDFVVFSEESPEQGDLKSAVVAYQEFKERANASEDIESEDLADRAYQEMTKLLNKENISKLSSEESLFDLNFQNPVSFDGKGQDVRYMIPELVKRARTGGNDGVVITNTATGNIYVGLSSEQILNRHSELANSRANELDLHHDDPSGMYADQVRYSRRVLFKNSMASLDYFHKQNISKSDLDMMFMGYEKDWLGINELYGENRTVPKEILADHVRRHMVAVVPVKRDRAKYGEYISPEGNSSTMEFIDVAGRNLGRLEFTERVDDSGQVVADVTSMAITEVERLAKEAQETATELEGKQTQIDQIKENLEKDITLTEGALDTGEKTEEEVQQEVEALKSKADDQIAAIEKDIALIEKVKPVSVAQQPDTQIAAKRFTIWAHEMGFDNISGYPEIFSQYEGFKKVTPVVYGGRPDPKIRYARSASYSKLQKDFKANLKKYLGTDDLAMLDLVSPMRDQGEYDPGKPGRVEKFMDEVALRLIDKYRPVDKAIRDIRKTVSISDDADVYRELTMMSDQANDRILRVANQMIQDKSGKKRSFLERMIADKVDPSMFSLYIWAKHAGERNASVKAGREAIAMEQVARTGGYTIDLMPDGGSGLYNAQAQEILDLFEKNGLTEKMDKWQAEYRQFTDMALDIAAEFDLLGDEDVAFYKTRWKNYVPLKVLKYMQEKTVNMGKGTPGVKIYKALGSKNMAERSNPILQIFLDIANNIQKGHNNKMKQSVVKLAEEAPDNKYFSVESMAYMPSFDRNGEVTGLSPAVQFASDDINTMVVRIREDGKLKYKVIRIAPTPNNWLAESINGHSYAKMNGFLRGLNRLNGWLRTVNTEMNPIFAFTNFTRDSQAAMMNMMAHHGMGMAMKTAGRVYKAAPAVLKYIRTGEATSKEMQDYQEYLELGGGFDMFDIRTYDDMEQKVAKQISDAIKAGMITGEGTEAGYVTKGLFHANNARKYIAGLVSSVNQMTESAWRLAYFSQLKETVDPNTNEKYTPERAAYLAKNLTVNFSKHGQWGKAMNALYLFSNSAIQGSYVMYNAVRRGKFGWGVPVGMIGLGFLQGVLGGIDFDDEDERGEIYNMIPDFIKERNWVFPLPRSTREFVFDKTGMEIEYFSFPMAYGWNFFPYLGSKIYDFVMGKVDPVKDTLDHSLDIMTVFMNGFNPVQGGTFAQTLAPTVADPAVQWWENKNWYGGPLTPTTYPGQLVIPSQHHFSNVGWLSKDITDTLHRWGGGGEFHKAMPLLEWNPAALDLIFNNLGGGLGKNMIDGFNMMGIMGDKIVSKIKGRDDKEQIKIHDVPLFRSFFHDISDFAYTQRVFELKNVSQEKVFSEEGWTDFYTAMSKSIETGGISGKKANQYFNDVTRNQAMLILSKEAEESGIPLPADPKELKKLKENKTKEIRDKLKSLKDLIKDKVKLEKKK